ncbi:hypothetical protein LguiB_007101 [Lonicera macranthoides]
MEILKVMGNKDLRFRNSAYRFMIHGLCKNKKVDLAIQIQEIMIASRCKFGEMMYSNIVKGVVAAGMTEKANELSQKLIEWKIFKEGTVRHEQSISNILTIHIGNSCSRLVFSKRYLNQLLHSQNEQKKAIIFNDSKHQSTDPVRGYLDLFIQLYKMCGME